jgi:predicted O-methyltransferase YrrM
MNNYTPHEQFLLDNNLHAESGIRRYRLQVSRNPAKFLVESTPTYQGPRNGNKRWDILNDLIQHHGWTLGAEIGVRKGHTQFQLLTENPNLTMYAVDKDVSQFHNSESVARFGHRMIVLEGDSRHMAKFVPHGSLDFVFIDADHTARAVKVWVPKLKPTGWITGHDVHMKDVYDVATRKFGNIQIGPDHTWFKAPDDNYDFLRKIDSSVSQL